MRASSPFAKRLAVATTFGLLVAAAAALPPLQWMHRIGLDLLLPLQANVLPLAARDPLVQVVAIDEATYADPAFAGKPQVAWTLELGRVIAALDQAGARVIGLDLIYPTTLDRPDLLPGHDRPFLRALAAAGRPGRLVMATARLSQRPIEPEQRQIVAVGGADNLRPVNLLLDPDEVVRRAVVHLPAEDGGSIPTFDGEIARRAGFAPKDETFLIDMRGREGAVTPVYGLADLVACADASDSGFFARFRDRIVLVGTTLDIEDRFSTSARLAPSLTAPQAGERCRGTALAEGSLLRGSMPGVLIHARAIETIVADSAPRVLSGLAAAVALGGWTMAATLALFAMSPAIGALVAGAALSALLAGAVALFAGTGIALPVVMAMPATGLAYAGTFAFRYLVEDAGKRRITHAFRHYLAPSLVEQLGANSDLLRPGGESRTVTVFFFDVAGFTTISEHLAERPEVLVALMNRYLSLMTGIIQVHGGYVDKYIGDAVMAVWGAPLPDDGSGCRRAVEAALACLAALDDFNRDVVERDFGLPPLGTRIGINTGIAVVGNMGSSDRLNYTVVGDTVNLAARLEGANKPFGTTIMIGPETRKGLPADFLVRRPICWWSRARTKRWRCSSPLARQLRPCRRSSNASMPLPGPGAFTAPVASPKPRRRLRR